MHGIILIALSLCLSASASAQSKTPPVPDAVAESQAMAIAYMPDSDPSLRLAQLLEAVELSEAALFVLAGTHPGLVEQIVSEDYRVALEYVLALPAPEVHRLRRGETVIRTEQVLRGTEHKRAIKLAEHFNFKRFKPKKLQATRVGTLEGRVIRVEVTVAKNRRKQLYNSIELAWPSTPERDESSRNRLSRHFGARPSYNVKLAGVPLALADTSFESDGTIGKYWSTQDAVILGSMTPVGEVAIDQTQAVDGSRCLSLHSDQRTRRFQDVYQTLPVEGGMELRARVLHRADSLKLEFEQRAEDVHISLTFLDEASLPIGEAVIAPARLSTHTWELLEITTTAPPGSQSVQLSLRSAVSGRSWFDAVTLTRTD